MGLALGPRRPWALNDPPHVVFLLDGPGEGDVSGGAVPVAARTAVLQGAEGRASRPRRRVHRVFQVPLEKLSPEPGERPTAAAGVLAWVAGIGRDVWLSAPGATGARGYDYAAANLPDLGLGLKRGPEGRMLLGGASAAGTGAAVAGCRVWASGSTGIAAGWLARRAADLGIVRCAADDAASAAFAALGAGHCGARALAEVPARDATAVRDAVAWAARAETPAVFLCGGDGAVLGLLAADAQRAPRAVLVPSSLEDLYRCVDDAFAWAEAYQCPACVLADAELLRRWETVDVLGPARRRERGSWADPAGEGAFDRYRDTDTGVSPRAAPGQERTLFVADGEDGGLPDRRRGKLQKKHLAMLGSLQGAFSLEGPAGADVTFVAQGCAAGVLRGALETVNAPGGRRANVLTVRQPVPFPAAGLSTVLKGLRAVRLVETHDEDPLRWLIHRETGFDLRPLRLGSLASTERLTDALRGALDG